MLQSHVNKTVSSLVVVLLGWPAIGCQRPQELHALSTTVLKAGSGTAAKTQLKNIVPSKRPQERLTVVIEDERYLGDIARQLGTSVDALLAMNKLTDTLLTRGQIVMVEATRDLVDHFVDKRERRKETKIAADEAKRQDKLRKEAEARSAKRQKMLEARARKRGIKIVAGHSPLDDKGPSAVPLRAGEMRQLGHGQMRGVALPVAFGIK